ncbi:MAG: aminomethyl-transferring glycine dehydrogenase subunit GcvPA [Thermodesulfobacteriota bacterium]|nr:aminomethyl-transferring glycine dehydrogenase subunit GcvPA [Thermodesulfobacteriota bacterium]
MTYIANTDKQRKEMLKRCGVSSIEDLFDVIPASLKPMSFSIPKGKAELEVYSYFEKLARQNYYDLISFLGGGFYDHFIPAAVDTIVGRSEFYTSYTPYQPELSQGTLQAIYEYQTDICRLTDMEVANASLYDGGTALYEACQMAISATGRRKVVVDGAVSPIYRKMIYSYATNLSIDFHETTVGHGQVDRERLFDLIDDSTAAVILQNPNFFGTIDDHSDIVQHCHNKGSLAIQSVNPIVCTVLKTPGEMGFDIATGEGQPLGIPLSFGGPYLGFMATKKDLVRKMPGRIVGRTVDTKGKEGFVLTLQTREQHIRREKATSNICTNQALCAMRAHVYMSLLGTEGLIEVARLCMDKANYTKERLKAIEGVEVMESIPTFNEFSIHLPIDAGECTGLMIERGFAAGFPLGRYYPGMENFLLVAVTEKRTKYEIGQFAEALEDVLCR